MDIDLSLIKNDWNGRELPRNIEDIDLDFRDGYLHIRRLLNNILLDSCSSAVMLFLQKIGEGFPSIFETISTLEIAYYYEASDHANFSAYYPHALLAILHDKNIALKVTCYPCEEE